MARRIREDWNTFKGIERLNTPKLVGRFRGHAQHVVEKVWLSLARLRIDRPLVVSKHVASYNFGTCVREDAMHIDCSR